MNSPFAPDLDAYFRRIGYNGPSEPTLDVLAALARRHVLTIPFENLDILLGRPISLEPADLERKLVRGRRGGYCFEHNGYFSQVLRTMGFGVTTLAARVRWQVPPGMTTPLTHMLLCVTAARQRYLVDVGFGSLSIASPLVFDSTGEQETPHEPRRIVIRADGSRALEGRFGDEWMEVCHFTPHEYFPADFEVANWWTSTHPLSRFQQNLIVARAGERVRYTVFNAEFTIRRMDGPTEKRVLQSPDELLDVLRETFDLHFPAGTRFGAPGAPWPR